MTTFLAWLAWFSICVGFACCMHLLAGLGRAAGMLGIALGAAALGVPFLIDGAPVLRAAVALYLLWSWFKVIDLVRDRAPRSARFRLIQALTIHDLRSDRFSRAGARPELVPSVLVSALAAGAIAVCALHVALFVAPSVTAPARFALRHAAGLVFAYFGVEGMLRAFVFVYRCAGLGPPTLHDHPILSSSLAEFWGRRWNRVVGGWLFATFYRPLAIRRRRVLGTIAAFVASAALHFYFTWAAIGAGWASCMAAFFLLQVPLVLLERRWHQQRWPAPWRRIWTVGMVLATSPLFIEPLLTIMEGGFAGDALAYR